MNLCAVSNENSELSQLCLVRGAAFSQPDWCGVPFFAVELMCSQRALEDRIAELAEQKIVDAKKSPGGQLMIRRSQSEMVLKDWEPKKKKE